MKASSNTDLPEGMKAGRRPGPFITEIRYQMDNCGATNKSQFCLGGLALLLMLGLPGTVAVFFMVVGHTKFGPDDLARAIAGAYQRGDSSNFAVFMRHVMSCANGEACDGSEVLWDFRAASEKLFNSVEKIMGCRVFYLVGDDDGKVDLGAPENLPADISPFPRSGPAYKRVSVKKEIEFLEERSLVCVMLSVFAKIFDGAGSGSGDFGPTPARILSGVAADFRKVRLFCAKKGTDLYVVEQEGLFKLSSKPKADGLRDINSALLRIRPYNGVGGKLKEPYGARKEQLRLMHGKYVPKWFVPDLFFVGLARSPILRQLVFERIQTGGGRTTSSRGGAAAADGQPQEPLVARYNQAKHAAALINILSHPKYQSKKRKLGQKEWKANASKIPCQNGYIFTPSSIKTASQRLFRARKA